MPSQYTLQAPSLEFRVVQDTQAYARLLTHTEMTQRLPIRMAERFNSLHGRQPGFWRVGGL